jgi:6-pyruvoyltetrahydropterin/6-carboxytetrahydropterin synthase
MTIFTEQYCYTAAHHLPTFPEGHNCRRVHGHTYKVTISLAVDDGPEGYAFDHACLDNVAAAVLGPLDHATINDVEGLEDGLAETQLAWLVERFRGALAELDAELLEVHLDECSSGGRFRYVKHRKSWKATSRI